MVAIKTKEAEFVVNHPRRRSIISWLMIVGNAGIVAVIVTATSSMVTSQGYQLPINVVVLAVGLFLIYRIATHKKIVKRWESFVEGKLMKYQPVDEDLTEDLLHFLEGYGLVRQAVGSSSSLVGRLISETALADWNVLVLGIERGETWIPSPKDDERIQGGDKLVLYGALETLRDLQYPSTAEGKNR